MKQDGTTEHAYPKNPVDPGGRTRQHGRPGPKIDCRSSGRPAGSPAWTLGRVRSFEIWRSSSRIGFAFPECADLSNDMFGVAVETTVLSGPGVEMRVAMSILVRFRVVRTLLWVVPTWGVSRSGTPGSLGPAQASVLSFEAGDRDWTRRHCCASSVWASVLPRHASHAKGVERQTLSVMVRGRP